LAAGLHAIFRSSVVALIALGAGTAFIFLGFVGVTLRDQCSAAFGDVGSCAGPVDPVATGSIVPKKVMEEALPAADAAEPILSTRDEKLRAAGLLITATFESLRGKGDAPKPQPAAIREPAEVASIDAATEATAAEALELETRKVRSVAVTPEGQPVVAPNDEFVAVAARQPAAEPTTPDWASVETGIAAKQAETIEPLAFAGAPIPASRHGTPVVTAVAPKSSITISGDDVSVRSGPAGSQSRLFFLDEGTTVEATAQQDRWVQVTDPKGRTGWVYADYLENLDLDALPVATVEVAAIEPEAVPEVAAEPEAPAKQVAAASGDVRTVGGAGVNVRSGPSTKQGKLFALAGGEQVTVTATERGWLQIIDDQGRSGWVYKNYVR
jgi:SH3-like domain-containing protein